jgi:hypothetical protein
MRQHHAFRPWLAEILEARAVPSVAGVTLPTGLPGINLTVPSQVPVNSPQVQAAIAAFDASYIRAVDALLTTPGPDGLVVPSNNQPAFLKAVEQSLSTLAEQLVLSLNAGSTSTTGGTVSGPPSTTGSGSGSTGTTTTAASQINSAILGGSNSLESELLALAAASLQFQVPNTSASTGTPAATPVANVVTTAEQVRTTLRVPVAESTNGSLIAATSPISSASSPAVGEVRSAFNNFLNDYFKAVQGVLLTPTGGAGAVNPQARRAAFDAEVDQALRALESRLSAALARDQATSGLAPKVLAVVGGDGPASLKGQLASLPTPEAPQASIVRDFTLGSTRAIARALAQITGDLGGN